MREYLLYVKVDKHSAQTYITPCFAVDRLYWQEREGGQLYVIGKSSSLALAFYLRGRLNDQLREGAFREEAVEEWRNMAVSCVSEMNAVYGREVDERQPLQEDWFCFEPVDEDAVQDDSAVTLDMQDVDRLAWVMSGRALLWEELQTLLQKRSVLIAEPTPHVQWLVLRGEAEWLPGVRLQIRKGWWRHRLTACCLRCGNDQSIELTVCHTCGQGCAYCTACLGMGRSKCCTPFLCCTPLSSRQKNAATGPLLKWDGTFSPFQAVAAERARRFVAEQKQGPAAFLIWAVCGAGKTELLFPAITEMLQAGGQVLVATPRKDVVLELVPRLQKAFPSVRVISVHGSSEEKWEEAELVIATTHQVMRYYRRFPLVVIDEADAFPYHNNTMLYHAVERAVAQGGKRLYLSATPPRYLRRQLVDRNGGSPFFSATHVLLPKRFHGYSLPVPQIRTVRHLQGRLANGQSIPWLMKTVVESLEQGRQVFVFVPRVDDVETVLGYLRCCIPARAEEMEGVHAADPNREQKVLHFRERRYRLLVTTTILERGVTVPRSDVIVLGADAPVFDEASLVQIAGRVGRSADSPTGTVLFLQEKRAVEAIKAVRQIRRMNRLAAKMGQEAGDVC